MADIELNNLTFTYPGSTEPVIDNLSLHIPAGESHALLGASGAGKTTLLNLLSGIEHPQSGTVLFDGQDVTQLGGRDRKVAQVFQFPVLYESLNVSANISFPLQNLNLGRQEIVERVRYIAQELNISELLDRSPQSLSLFEKQLVAVAKALVRPDLSVVLLDEPLTAVEPKIKWQLRRALRNVKRDLGVTMIYVTHDQTEALTFADRVSVLTAEGILQTDTPEQIYHNPTHEFVGHFIGSPGMNFLNAQDLTLIEGAQTLGFRPEWVVEDNAAPHFSAVVEHVKAEGMRDGEAFGVVRLALPGASSVTIRGPLTTQIGDTYSARLTRAVGFVDGQNVGQFDAAL